MQRQTWRQDHTKTAVLLMEQVDKMIGKGAPADFIENLEELAKTHHADMALDNIRAYYFGQRFIVEMEVVLPSAMTVRESHDIALILQHKVCFLLAVDSKEVPQLSMQISLLLAYLEMSIDCFCSPELCADPPGRLRHCQLALLCCFG